MLGQAVYRHRAVPDGCDPCSPVPRNRDQHDPDTPEAKGGWSFRRISGRGVKPTGVGPNPGHPAHLGPAQDWLAVCRGPAVGPVVTAAHVQGATALPAPPQGPRNRCPRYKAVVHEVEAAGPRVGSGSAGASRKAFCAIKGVSPSRPATGVSRTPTAMCPAPWPRCFLCACLLQAVGLSLSGRRVSGHHKAPERRDAARSRRGPMRFAFRYRQNPFWGPAFVEREL